MLGRFLEIGLATSDIAESVQFYEGLGFAQLTTGDIWSHLYGVLSDGRVHLGLHQRSMPTPTLTFVRPQLAQSIESLRSAGSAPESTHLGEEDFHEVQLKDPSGQAITLLEARTYSPAAPHTASPSLCGYFLHYSLPVSQRKAAREFWEHSGFVALAEVQEPYALQPLTSDLFDLAFHKRRSFDSPLLVFEVSDLGACRVRLAHRGIEPVARLPFGLRYSDTILIRAPEGTLLLLLATKS